MKDFNEMRIVSPEIRGQKYESMSHNKRMSYICHRLNEVSKNNKSKQNILEKSGIDKVM